MMDLGVEGLHNPESAEVDKPEPRLIYLLSSKKGLGHASRAIAVVEKMSPKAGEVIFGGYPQIKDYLEAGLGQEVDFQDLSYDFSPSSMPRTEEEMDSARITFVESNSDLLKKIKEENPSVLLTDFLAQAPLLREYIEENQLDTKLIGIYHSLERSDHDETGSSIDAWQENISKVVDAMDVLFLVELNKRLRPPYITDSGTLVCPVGPLVREVTRHSQEIKSELGIEENQEYILVQAGMRGNGALSNFIRQAASSDQLKEKVFVIMYWDDEFKDNLEGVDNVRYLPKAPDGHNYVANAAGVIGKPGMQTLSECVAYRTPILFVDDPHPERQIKIDMLQQIVKEAGIDEVVLDLEGDVGSQVIRWIEQHDKYKKAFGEIPEDSSYLVAQLLERIEAEGLVQTENRPTVRSDAPPGKKEGQLDYWESRKKIQHWKEEIEQRLIQPLKDASVPASLIAFGGAGKGMLRPDSDLDMMAVVRVEDLGEFQKILEQQFQFQEPLTQERLDSLKNNQYDSLRLKANLNDGTELNVSLMTDESYRKIFSPFTEFFREELGKRISGNPYSVPDFTGLDYALPKVYEVSDGEGKTKKVRLSPGIVEQQGRKLLGVKQRMLLTSDAWHDGLQVGEPTRKIIRGVTRALCYWNNLYQHNDENKVTGVVPEAYDKNYFFRILRDPLTMYSPQKAKQLRDLFFNELRRIDYIAQRRYNSNKATH